MDRYRYGRPPGSGLDRLAALALEELGRGVRRGATPREALHGLLRRGLQDTPGIDGVLEEARLRRERLLSAGHPDGTLTRARSLLERALRQERAVLSSDGGGAARLREVGLGSVPADVPAALRALADYRWRSAAARATFDRLWDLVYREIAEAWVPGAKEGLREAPPATEHRFRAMLAALTRMLEADARGASVDDAAFLAEYGDLLPRGPRDLDELVDLLARRAAALRRVLESVPPQRNAELRGLVAVGAEEAGIAGELERLSEALRARRPDLAFSGGRETTGPSPLGLGAATTVARELADLAEVEAALRSQDADAALERVDLAAVSRCLGDTAAEDLTRLGGLERRLREGGYLEGTRRRPRLTPRAVRRLGEAALREATAALEADPRNSAIRGCAGEPSGHSTGAALAARNAVGRERDPRGRLRLDPHDLAPATGGGHGGAAAVCLLLDMSYSMVRGEVWDSAKAAAMALNTLVSTRFPQDALRVIGFNDRAREIPGHELLGLAWEPVQGTNLQHALALAGRHLDRCPGFDPVVLVVTDGEPTAHLEPDGSVSFAWPPSPRTTEATLAEVDRMARREASLTTFLLSGDARLEDFARRARDRGGGRVVPTDGGELGGRVVRELLRRRR
ncbi:uncharacterized protein with von Willebrand factor type A (vWA) domain [Haloactinospora alba]|uniref:Uncharacterized protein with von Willebrand factor type A (VWA) domain n=1 Tax=Haloactinospora alba TaxID=405555 RepID=A0A543NM48_9ACTN|nr:hypothetical protein [Haloactinospora alba]TQN32900.1 uncharacterized protein with von Willebrand factor type A (vWA) domain [Haloactinospora alba]